MFYGGFRAATDKSTLKLGCAGLIALVKGVPLVSYSILSLWHQKVSSLDTPFTLIEW